VSRGVDWIYWALGTLVGLAGLALLAWSLFADRPRGRRRCPKCWYDLSGSPQLTCSECGHVAGRARALRRTRRRWRWAIAALLLAGVGYGIAVTPRCRGHGWRGSVPTTLLLVAQPWLDDHLAGSLEVRVMTRKSWMWQRAWYARSWESTYLEAQGKARGAALHVIGLVGPAAEGCLPTVFAAARDQDPFIRSTAAYAMGLILSDSEASLPVLVNLLRDEDGAVRGNAAWALWTFSREFRGQAEDAVPALTESLNDESEWVRLHSAVALGWITGDARHAVSETLRALASSTPDLGIYGTITLGELDPALEGIVPTLCKAAAHPDARVRRAAAWKLARAGALAADAVPMLIEMLKDRQNDLHVEAANALGQIGPAASQAIAELQELQADPEPEANQAAAKALSKIRRVR
jgi:HEAT repeat protein